VNGEDFFRVFLRKRAQKEVDRLPANIFDRILETLDSLRSEPRPHGAKKLSGLPEWRVRIGDYRILYRIDDSERTLEIVSVGHRREVYRNL
jgi:mRNA interferase RelE/StbE